MRNTIWDATARIPLRGLGNGIGIALRHENHVFFNSEQLWAHACDQFTDSDTESETESDDEAMEF